MTFVKATTKTMHGIKAIETLLKRNQSNIILTREGRSLTGAGACVCALMRMRITDAVK